jgi:hypothetical protein
VLGQRDEALARELMEDACKRLAHPHDLVLIVTAGFKMDRNDGIKVDTLSIPSHAGKLAKLGF